MATVLNRDDLTELATLVPLIRDLHQASFTDMIKVPPESIELLKQRVATLLAKLKKQP